MLRLGLRIRTGRGRLLTSPIWLQEEAETSRAWTASLDALLVVLAALRGRGKVRTRRGSQSPGRDGRADLIESPVRQAAVEAHFLSTGRLQSLDRMLHKLFRYLLLCSGRGDAGLAHKATTGMQALGEIHELPKSQG
jgi:hypothetical protein